MEIRKLTPPELRWVCDPSQLAFETTESVDASRRPVGQIPARQALEFGLLCGAPGQNIYVRGSRGTGRLTVVRSMLEELAPTTDRKRDYCYVHNFRQPDRPRLLVLGPGQARHFARRVGELARFIEDGLRQALDSEPHALRRLQLRQELEADIAGISAPLEKDLAANQMALVSVQ